MCVIHLLPGGGALHELNSRGCFSHRFVRPSATLQLITFLTTCSCWFKKNPSNSGGESDPCWDRRFFGCWTLLICRHRSHQSTIKLIMTAIMFSSACSGSSGIFSCLPRWRDRNIFACIELNTTKPPLNCVLCSELKLRVMMWHWSTRQPNCPWHRDEHAGVLGIAVMVYGMKRHTPGSELLHGLQGRRVFKAAHSWISFSPSSFPLVFSYLSVWPGHRRSERQRKLHISSAASQQSKHITLFTGETSDSSTLKWINEAHLWRY